MTNVAYCALQIWIYEVIFIAGKEFGMSINQRLSRMLRWKSLKSNIHDKKIATHILSTDAVLFSIVGI